MFLLRFLRLLLVPVLFMATLSTAVLHAEEMTQDQRNEMAAKLIPIITMLLMDDGDRVSPVKPTLTTPVGSEASSGTQSVEVNGEAGAKVYVNGVEAGTVGSNGKVTIQLTFSNGNNVMNITLKDPAGNESEALVFIVSYDAPPVITLNGTLYAMIIKGEAYVELGAMAEDENDGSVTVDINGFVDTSIVGDYNITYTARDSQGHTSVIVRKVEVIMGNAVVENFSLDITKVENYNTQLDLNSLVGKIENQYWIQAFGKLTEIELRQVVSQYNSLTILGYSESYGLLVQIPLENAEAMSALKNIELTKDISNVRKRIYLGRSVDKLNIFTPPDDNSRFDDNGSNWHLESINILKAWEITTGSPEVAVGIIDGGFYSNHEDLSVNIKNKIALEAEDEGYKTHGTAVASIIGATTNNKKGISGINWSSPLVLTEFKDKNLENRSYEVMLKNIFEESNSGDKIKVVNLSIGSDPAPLDTAKEIAQYKYDAFKKYNQTLFILSAGNEHNDSELTNGALHLVSKDLGIEEDNILVVAALLRDGTLPYYSNYGDTVDIAAPSQMKAAKDITFKFGFVNHGYYQVVFDSAYGTDNEYSLDTFDGTSAAAPVVTGVASLIYSINPEFTPQEVKNILIKSASTVVTKMHKVNNYQVIGELIPFYDSVEPIPSGHPIPILDAGAAVQMAKDYMDAKKIDLSYSYPSVFSRDCKIGIESVSSKFTIESVSYDIKGVTSDGALSDITGVFDNVNNEIIFNTNPLFSEYRGEAIVTYTGFSATAATISLVYDRSDVVLHLQDKVTDINITDATVIVEYLGENISSEQVTLSSGAMLYFEKRKPYKIHVEKTGYKTYSEEFRILSDKIEDMFIKLVPSDTNITGALHGIISDANTSLSNATVTIYSDTASYVARTGTTGIYRIVDIPILDSAGEYIWYDINVSRKGYISALKRGIGLSDGKSSMESFTLKKDPNYSNIPPVANAGVDQSIQVEESITLSGELSSDMETGTAYLQYQWSGATIATSYEQNVTLANLSEGTHHIVLQVTDEEGAVSTDTVVVTVASAGTITHNNTTYGTVTSPYTGKVWLDRNLGAAQVCTSFNDTACYGDYYQWGRNLDGHQDSTSATTSTQATDVNSAGSSFITGSSDWASVDGTGTTRTANWSVTDGSSVCPSGFRVPTLAELKAETLDNGVTNSATAFSNFLKVPAAGYRYNLSGALDGQGSWGSVWTSAVDGSYSHDVTFDSSSAGTVSINRADGCTVRCLRD